MSFLNPYYHNFYFYFNVLKVVSFSYSTSISFFLISSSFIKLYLSFFLYLEITFIWEKKMKYLFYFFSVHHFSCVSSWVVLRDLIVYSILNIWNSEFSELSIWNFFSFCFWTETIENIPTSWVVRRNKMNNKVFNYNKCFKEIMFPLFFTWNVLGPRQTYIVFLLNFRNFFQYFDKGYTKKNNILATGTGRG